MVLTADHRKTFAQRLMEVSGGDSTDLCNGLAEHRLERHGDGDGTPESLDPLSMRLEPCCLNAVVGAAYHPEAA